MRLHEVKQEVIVSLYLWAGDTYGCSVCNNNYIWRGDHHRCARKFLKASRVFYCECSMCKDNPSHHQFVHYFNAKDFSSPHDMTLCKTCAEGNHPDLPIGLI